MIDTNNPINENDKVIIANTTADTTPYGIKASEYSVRPIFVEEVSMKCILCGNDTPISKPLCKECRETLNIIMSKERFGAYKERGNNE